MSRESFPIVGLGASAGGLEALEEFFKALSDAPGAAFVIIQHLSPDYKSLMDELLARHTALPITVVNERTTVEVNHIYLLPPKKNMVIEKGALLLTDKPGDSSLNLPIDIFLRSLAGDQGKNAIGIILSGTGSDGTLGIRAISEAGGVTFVQDDKSAKFNGMPRSSIATGIIDYILPADKLAQQLEAYISHPLIASESLLKNQVKKDTSSFEQLLELVRLNTGIDFSSYKESTLLRRLEKRISLGRFENLEAYTRHLLDHPEDIGLLYNDLLIGVTRFFRDEKVFEELEQKVLKPLVESKHPGDQIRIWIPGCSTGEEAYTIAMLLDRQLGPKLKAFEIKIFATDIDNTSLEYAGIGLYPESVITDLPPELLSRCFTRKETGYQIKESIRSMVVFARHDLLADPPFSKLDLISCRNLLIYLEPEVQKTVLTSFHQSLVTDGYLLLGSSESLGSLSTGFDTISSKGKTYRKKKGSSFATAYPPKFSYARGQVHELKSTEAYFDGKRRGKKTIDQIAGPLFSVFVPPSVVVDRENTVIHTIGEVGKYLSLPSGDVSLDILKMADKQVATIISSILRRLRAEGDFAQVISYENLHLVNERFTLCGRNLEGTDRLILISFEPDEEERQGLVIDSVDMGEQYDQRLQELERELKFKSESLQAAIEELETSNEELQSSNEELIASNEELQSTNEELQSVNEELYTVNNEYQKKIEELTELNSDMNNLMKNTRVGTLFLDRNLVIRKINEVATSLTNIRPSDIGRPIDHISFDRFDANFVGDLQALSEDLQPREKELRLSSGQWYLLRMLPYRTEEGTADGIMVTFIEISSLKASQQYAQKILSRLDLTMQVGGISWWEWDYPTRTVTAGREYYRMLGYSAEDFSPTVDNWTELIHPDDREHAMGQMRRLISGESELYEQEFRMRTRAGDYLWFRDYGSVVSRDAQGRPIKLTGVMLNIERERESRQREYSSCQIIESLIDLISLPSTVVDHTGRITHANESALLLLGLTEEQISSRSYDDESWRITDLEGMEMDSEGLPFEIIRRTRKPVKGITHAILTPERKIDLCIDGIPLFDAVGSFDGAVFTLKELSQQSSE